MQPDENFIDAQHAHWTCSAPTDAARGGRTSGSAAQRSKARESMLNVTAPRRRVEGRPPTRCGSGGGGAAAARRAARRRRRRGGDGAAPPAARPASATTTSPATSSPTAAAGSRNMLAALSNAVTPAEDGDALAGSRVPQAAAAAQRRARWPDRLGDVPGEEGVATYWRQEVCSTPGPAPTAASCTVTSPQKRRRMEAARCSTARLSDVVRGCCDGGLRSPAVRHARPRRRRGFGPPEATDVAAAPRIARPLARARQRHEQRRARRARPPVPIAFALPLDGIGPGHASPA